MAEYLCELGNQGHRNRSDSREARVLITIRQFICMADSSRAAAAATLVRRSRPRAGLTTAAVARAVSSF